VGSVAQDLEGIINFYSGVSFVDHCKNNITVLDTAGFAEGDAVILIQMKGATVDSTGNIVDFGAAGRFEKNIIDSIRGNVFTFRFTMLHDYTELGSVQIVSMPSYKSARVVKPLTCKPWDGISGGVLAFAVADSMILNADIDVSGRGFRGDTVLASGEGIAGITNVPATRWANGGGYSPQVAQGGSGGTGMGSGGGGHHGCGGEGVESCTKISRRVPGGQEIRYDAGANWIFMGGAGGSGTQPSLTSGSAPTILAGGNGGGILILNVPVIIGDGNATIHSNGGQGTRINPSGKLPGAIPAGGGAGGALMVTAYIIRYVPFLSAHGGDATQTPWDTLQPIAGSGGGGTIRLGTTSPLNLNFGHYDAGKPSGQNCVGTKGCSGRVYYNNGLNIATQTHRRRYVLNKADTAMCVGDTVALWARTVGRVTWYVGANPICDSCDTALVSPQQTTQYWYRTVYSDFCEDSGSVEVVVYDLPQPNLQTPDPICIRDSTLLSAAPGMAKYRWSTGDTTQSFYARTVGWYHVTVTNTNGCSQTDSVFVSVLPKRILDIIELRGLTELTLPSVYPNELSNAMFTIQNTFTVPAIVRNVELASNTQFSVPLPQFPFTVNGGQTQQVWVYASNEIPGTYRDTITIIEPCGETLVPVAFTVFETPWISKCNVRVTSQGEMEDFLEQLRAKKIEFVVFNLVGEKCLPPYMRGTYIVRTSKSVTLLSF